MEGLVKTVSKVPKPVHVEEKSLAQAKLAVTCQGCWPGFLPYLRAVLAAAVATAWLQLQHSTDGQYHQPPNPITAPTISQVSLQTSVANSVITGPFSTQSRSQVYLLIISSSQWQSPLVTQVRKFNHPSFILFPPPLNRNHQNLSIMFPLKGELFMLIPNSLAQYIKQITNKDLLYIAQGTILNIL